MSFTGRVFQCSSLSRWYPQVAQVRVKILLKQVDFKYFSNRYRISHVISTQLHPKDGNIEKKKNQPKLKILWVFLSGTLLKFF